MTSKTHAVDDLKYLTKELLRSTTLKSFCLVGDWGVGKTYAWKEIVEELRESPAPSGVKHYAYISLFGLSAVEQVSAAIIQETEQFDLQQDRWYWVVPKWFHFLVRVIGKLGILLACMVGKLPLVLGKRSPQYFWALAKHDSILNAFRAVGNELLPWMPEKALICFDDIERRNASLAIDQLLGLVSHLQENAQCKIVFIFNENHFNENRVDAGQFQKNYEKVFDATFKFQPDLVERIDIGVSNDNSNSTVIKRYAEKLEIQNIRVLKRIVWLCDEVKRALGDVKPSIHERAVEIIVLLESARCIGHEDRAKLVQEYLSNEIRKENFIGVYSSIEPTKEGAEWAELVVQYGFDGHYDFDKDVIEGVLHGFFKKEALKKSSSKLTDLRDDNEKRMRHKDAWGLYEDSFADNESVVVNALERSFEENISILDIHDLNRLVCLFESLSREKIAREIIQTFKAQQTISENNWTDLVLHESRQLLLHDWIIETVRKKVSHKIPPNFSEIMNKILEKHDWNKGDIELLAESSDREFLEFVKINHSGGKHSAIGRIFNIQDTKDTPMEVVQNKCRSALKEIATESPLNELRIREFYEQ